MNTIVREGFPGVHCRPFAKEGESRRECVRSFFRLRKIRRLADRIGREGSETASSVQANPWRRRGCFTLKTGFYLRMVSLLVSISEPEVHGRRNRDAWRRGQDVRPDGIVIFVLSQQ